MMTIVLVTIWLILKKPELYFKAVEQMNRKMRRFVLLFYFNEDAFLLKEGVNAYKNWT